MTTENFEFNIEARQRQHLTLVALGKRPADILIRGVTLLNVFTLDWHADHDIVVSGDRIAWIGPTGLWTGEVATVFDRAGLFAVPGFGEPHKHIESTHLTRSTKQRWSFPTAIPGPLRLPMSFPTLMGGRT